MNSPVDFNTLLDPRKWCFPAFIYGILVSIVLISIILLPEAKATIRDRILAFSVVALGGLLMIAFILAFCKAEFPLNLLAWAPFLLPLV